MKNIVVLLALSLPAVCHAAASAPIDTRSEFARPHQMVDVGGRRLNLYCSGSGPVTVVFDAPSGDAGWNWSDVQPAVAKHARACVYDRAGFGFSDPSPRPGTSGNAVEDLHKLLGAAGIAPPYVMVGSSYGGANVQLYAYRYSSEVKGLVLVEGQHEDETARVNKATNGKMAEVQTMFAQLEAACLAQSEKGFVQGSELHSNCVGDGYADFGRALGAARLAQNLSPAYRRARHSEESNFDVGNGELRSARRSFGDLPLIVLVRGVSPFAVPGKPQSALNKALEDENLAMQKEIAALSTRSELRVVPGASHIIHDKRPDAVIKAVADILAQASPAPR